MNNQQKIRMAMSIEILGEYHEQLEFKGKIKTSLHTCSKKLRATKKHIKKSSRKYFDITKNKFQSFNEK